MAHPNEDLVRESIAAGERGDMDALRKQYWTEDICMHIPGRSLLAGDYQGIEQVLQVLARASELSGGTSSTEMHDALANDEHGVVMLTTRGERAGKQLNDNLVLVYHFRDGKIAEVWTHPTDQYAEDEFWS
jgi:ketosteroid isomerase-like protein